MTRAPRHKLRTVRRVTTHMFHSILQNVFLLFTPALLAAATQIDNPAHSPPIDLDSTSTVISASTGTWDLHQNPPVELHPHSTPPEPVPVRARLENADYSTI